MMNGQDETGRDDAAECVDTPDAVFSLLGDEGQAEDVDSTAAAEQESGGGEVADTAAESGPAADSDESVDDVFRRVAEELIVERN
ncbi:hypothetical protein OH799_33660 [Nocardia sp. NBC_00881]|uniref:hypothetical protein n=1 Tax=Nocardia sp. NBC_00881 TaxID=2975995 RepID=UPI00386AC545|nr:hypothetical protein OH799_33660 [Nocardia sp. NBC_00881]